MIHRTIYELQHKNEYKDLLGSFEFLDYARFPYSPLLGRIFNRLQESQLLSSKNPGYVVYQIEDSSRDAIEDYFLKEDKVLHQYRDKLEEIGMKLTEKLKIP